MNQVVHTLMKVITLVSTISLTACGTLKNEYTINNQDMREDHSTLKLVGTMVVMVAIAKAIAPKSNNTTGSQGRCQHYNDRARDGSLCGLRSADSRPGGR